MMTYEEFEKRCLKELIMVMPEDWAEYMRGYLKEYDSQDVLREFYEMGVKRYENNKKHDNDLAFGYCVSTAVENLRLMY